MTHPAAAALPECDCTVWCGDDQRLREGRVRECDERRRNHERILRNAVAHQLLRELGLADMLEAVRELRDRRRA